MEVYLELKRSFATKTGDWVRAADKPRLYVDNSLTCFYLYTPSNILKDYISSIYFPSQKVYSSSYTRVFQILRNRIMEKKKHLKFGEFYILVKHIYFYLHIKYTRDSVCLSFFTLYLATLQSCSCLVYCFRVSEYNNILNNRWIFIQTAAFNFSAVPLLIGRRSIIMKNSTFFQNFPYPLSNHYLTTKK